MDRNHLRDLRSALGTLDEAIGELRRELAILSAVDGTSSPAPSATKAPMDKDASSVTGTTEKAGESAEADAAGKEAAEAGTKVPEKPAEPRTPVPQKPNYNAISDPARLQRLLTAKEKSMANLESRLAVLRAERE